MEDRDPLTIEYRAKLLNILREIMAIRNGAAMAAVDAQFEFDEYVRHREGQFAPPGDDNRRSAPRFDTTQYYMLTDGLSLLRAFDGMLRAFGMEADRDELFPRFCDIVWAGTGGSRADSGGGGGRGSSDAIDDLNRTIRRVQRDRDPLKVEPLRKAVEGLAKLLAQVEKDAQNPARRPRGSGLPPGADGG